MKLFLPLTKDRFRLLEDWPVPFVSWQSGFQVSTVLKEGSIISIDSHKTTKVTKPTDGITVNIRVAYDDMANTMRQYGGNAHYGQSFRTTRGELATVELELALDVP